MHNQDAVLGRYKSDVTNGVFNGAHDPDAFAGWYDQPFTDYVFSGNVWPVAGERLVDVPGPDQEVEITLDSGAAASVMPESWLSENCKIPTRLKLWDAQGAQMHLKGAQCMHVHACIPERFLATSVDVPLLSFGRLLKDGWSLQNHRSSDRLCLCKEECEIPVFYRRNSLMMKASIFLHLQRANQMMMIMRT